MQLLGLLSVIAGVAACTAAVVAGHNAGGRAYAMAWLIGLAAGGASYLVLWLGGKWTIRRFRLYEHNPSALRLVVSWLLFVSAFGWAIAAAAIASMMTKLFLHALLL